MQTTKFIFDLDGTLYRFKGSDTFAASPFYADIKRNIFSFLEAEGGIPADQIQKTYARWKKEYGGHVSLAVERELGIDRERYFRETWNVDPAAYIVPSDEPRRVLEQLQGRFAILTEAPRVWAEAALRFLNVFDLVGDALFTGDPDVRKPAPEAFARVGAFLNVPFDTIYSVGDQEESDVLAPRSIGMRAVRIGGDKTVADYQISNVSDLPTLPLP